MIAQFVRPTVAAVVVLIAACAIRGPTPLPRIALGCYRVSADGWTEETGELVGFSELPEVIALDTVVLVPKDWSWISWNKINFAYWSSTSREWLLLFFSVASPSKAYMVLPLLPLLEETRKVLR